MENRITELKSTVMLNIITQLSKREIDGKVSWICIGENSKERHSQVDDFEMLHKAFTNGDFKGSAAICLTQDGTGMVKWDINLTEVTEKD